MTDFDLHAWDEIEGPFQSSEKKRKLKKEKSM